MTFSTGFTHIAGTDDTALLYNANTGLGAVGTLTNGAWAFTQKP
jgi:hypothetical protein